MRIWVKKKNPQWQDVQTNLEVILNPKSFSEIENKNAKDHSSRKGSPYSCENYDLRLIIFLKFNL
jgi:hypothetical protein